MPAYVALLRAVNVGGTGKLPMSDLVQMARSLGFEEPRTYIASGNLVFRSAGTEAEVRDALEARLETYAGKRVGVMIRTGEELIAILTDNPFPEKSPSRTLVYFLNDPPPAGLDSIAGPDGEEVRSGRREIYVHYPAGSGRSRLKLPAAKEATSRNVNTVTRLAEMALELG
jgi:uncharacterized protein (DUF1697 family)